MLTAFILMAFSYNTYSQEIIKSDTTFTRQVKVFEKFSLDFISCPSCGCDWYIKTFIDHANLIIVDSATVKNNVNRIGGFSTKSWTFEGLTKGDYQLLFIYKRPWLKEIELRATVNIKIE